MSYKDHLHYPGLWAPLLMLLNPVHLYVFAVCMMAHLRFLKHLISNLHPSLENPPLPR